MARVIIVIALIAVAVLLWYAFGPRRGSSLEGRGGLFERGRGVSAPTAPPSDPSVNYPQGWNGRGGSYWRRSRSDSDESGAGDGGRKRPLGPDDDTDFLNSL